MHDYIVGSSSPGVDTAATNHDLISSLECVNDGEFDVEGENENEEQALISKAIPLSALVNSTSYNTKQLLKRINVAVSKIVNSNTISAFYKGKRRQYCPNAIQLTTYTPTRWNSAIKCMEAFLANREVLREVFEMRNNDEVFRFTDEDYAEASKLMEYLKVFETFTKQMSSIDCTCPLVLPFMQALMRQFRNLKRIASASRDESTVRSLESSIAKLKKYKDQYDMNPMLILASQMAPSHFITQMSGLSDMFELDKHQETKLLDFIGETPYPVERDDDESGDETVLEFDSEMTEAEASLRSEFSISNEDRIEDGRVELEWAAFLEWKANSVLAESAKAKVALVLLKRAHGSAKDEFSRFLAQETRSSTFLGMKSTRQFNRFYVENKDRLTREYPRMYVHMERILVAQGSSVSTERTFSELRKVVTTERKDGLMKKDTQNLKSLVSGKSICRIMLEESAYISSIER